jgi:hypothetical protein
MRDSIPDGRASGPGLLRRDELPTQTVSATLGGRTASSELNFRCDGMVVVPHAAAPVGGVLMLSRIGLR